VFLHGGGFRVDRVGAVVDRWFLRGSARRQARRTLVTALFVAGLLLTGLIPASLAAPVRATSLVGPAAATRAPSAQPQTTQPQTGQPQTRQRRVAPEPLTLTIDKLRPAVIPEQGPLRASGTITNDSADEWDNIGIYPLTSAEPLTTSEELATAVASDPALPVGDRITDLGPLDLIDSLAPGDTTSYSLRIPRRLIEISGESGVYWFGVQALGEVDGVREEVPVADGRARTFLPYVEPARTTRKNGRGNSRGNGRQNDEVRNNPVANGEVRTALVIPVRENVTRQLDGRVDQVANWAANMSPGGRLRRMVEFGAAAQANLARRRPVTWLIDPAVADAGSAIAGGNLPFDFSSNLPIRPPPASESPTPSPDDGAGDEPEVGASGGASDNEPAPENTPEPDPNAPPPPAPGADAEQAAAAADWLNRLTAALRDAGPDAVVSLPYGDLDVAATGARHPELVSSARARSEAVLDRLKVAAEPGIAPPGGRLPPGTYPAIELGETILVTERSFTGPAPERANVDGRIVTTSTYVPNGPGPNDRRSPVALRQMILSEAALRLLQDDTVAHSLVVQFPRAWEPPQSSRDAAEFFAGFDDIAWFRLSTLADAATTTPSTVEPGDLKYRAVNRRQQLPVETIDAARMLITAGQTLQATLSRNDLIADEVLDAALTTMSYADREVPGAAQAGAHRSREWIKRELAKISISTPPSLTLSSGSGPLPATVSNGLDYPVTVRIGAQENESVEVTGPRRLRLAPGERVAVKLQITTKALGVNNVRLVVTDVNDVPLGGATTLPVRSTEVGEIGWVIIGVGVALLVLAIGLRLGRSLVRERRGRATTTNGETT
jgi:Family of unknown function (DUF6049)